MAYCRRYASPGASPVTVWFDRRTGHPRKAVLEVDGGEETTVYRDWRRVRGFSVAFRRTTSDTAGATTVLAVEAVTTRGIDATGLARPSPRSRGRMHESLSARTAFQFAAFDRGHIVVAVTINGRAARLLFDTGGAHYLTPAAARRLTLPVAGGVNIGGVGTAIVRGGFAQVRTLAIGSAQLDDQSAIVGPLPYPAVHPRAGLIVDGLTGYEFLAEFRTTIDYAAQTLTFARFASPFRPQGVTVPFYSDGHSIYVEATIEGSAGIFRLDTGDGGALTVFRSFADRHGLFPDRGRPAISAGGVGGAIATRDSMARRFVFAGSAMAAVPVTISDTSAGAFFSRSLAGNLGAAVLARFTITFDYQAHTLTLVPNDRFGTPFDRERTGLSVDQRSPSAFDVLSVAAGSPAADAGIRAGDNIVEVNGRSVAADALGVFDLSPLRYGDRPFSLSLRRRGTPLPVTIAPKAF